jgi:hypothetical protein
LAGGATDHAGRSARYSELAIETALILRAVFHHTLRQTEGIVGSLLELMGVDLPVLEPVRASAAITPH